jgi:superoxide dismutase, Cu-Zn family
MQKLGFNFGMFGVSSLRSGLACSVALLGLATSTALGCGGAQESAAPPATPEAPPPAEPPPADSAEAATAPEAAAPKSVETIFQAKSGSKLAGKATLTETAEGVKVVLAVDGVAPGDHGSHVHEKGDCSAPDGASAGGHFNPAASPHALPASSPRHLGDLGNIVVAADGKGTLEIVAPGANLKEGDPNSFLGRAIIVHEKKDDGGQPTGNAGGRIGCAEIK